MLTSLSHADELQAPWLLTWSGSLVLVDNVAYCENTGHANPDAWCADLHSNTLCAL